MRHSKSNTKRQGCHKHPHLGFTYPTTVTHIHDDFLGFVAGALVAARFGAALVVLAVVRLVAVLVVLAVVRLVAAVVRLVAVDLAAVVRLVAVLAVVAVDLAAVVRLVAVLIVVERPFRVAGFTSVAGSYVATSARSLMM